MENTIKLKTCSFSSIIRASGIYDIIMMLPFAIPGVTLWVFNQIRIIHESLALPGSIPEFSPLHLLFINLMACVTIIWSVLRVKYPKPIYILYDTIARITIAAYMLIYLLIFNITGIMWVFVTSEILWATIQINGYFFKYRDLTK